MRILPLLAVLLAATAGAAPRIASEDAVRHRGERVTLAGPVSAVETRPDGTAVLMVGTDIPVPVVVAGSVRARLGRDLTELRGQEIELMGTVTSGDQPLALMPDNPEQQLAAAAKSPADEVRVLRERVRALEEDVARLRASIPAEGQTGITYGPTARKDAPIPPYASQTTVLAERGIPSRMGWGSHGRVLYYGRERWTFDEKGQLLGVRRDP